MAYTNQTVNYGIPLPLGTDKFNPLDWNDSSEKIDAAVHDAQSVAQTAAQDIVTLQADVTGLKNEDIAIKQAATELTGRVTTLEQSDAKVTDDIQDCLDMITAREVLVAQSPIEIAVGKWFRYNGILYVCTVEIGIGDTIVPNVNCRATNIESEMGQGGGSASASGTSFDDTKATLGASNVQDAIDVCASDIDTNINDIASLLARVTALEKGGGMKPVANYHHNKGSELKTVVYTNNSSESKDIVVELTVGTNEPTYAGTYINFNEVPTEQNFDLFLTSSYGKLYKKLEANETVNVWFQSNSEAEVNIYEV